jgi:hypothetical protein
MAKKPISADEANAGGSLDIFPVEINPAVDLLAARGVAFQDSNTRVITDDGTNITAQDDNTMVAVNLETMAWGNARYNLFTNEYYRVPLGHNHVIYQEVAIDDGGEYEVLGEMVILE